MKEKIKNLFKNLSQKEQDVIVLLFGLGNLPKSPEEIGALFGVDKSEIIQVAEQALTKLPVSAEELKNLNFFENTKK